MAALTVCIADQIVKLVIQIPCFNEEANLKDVLSELPREIEGISQIEVIVIDDGSTDLTAAIAQEYAVSSVVRHGANLGLAATFRSGLDASLGRGADIIVNIDGDHQYHGNEIPLLIAPILAGRADMVVGDRQTDTLAHFSPLKRYLQRIGSRIVRALSGTKVRDTTSGFRAFTRDAALKLTVLSAYTYTHETLLQSRAKRIVVVDVPVRARAVTRPSRLMRNTSNYIINSMLGIVRIFAMYNPLRIFFALGVTLFILGLVLVGRFVFFYLSGDSSGKIQSLVIAAIFTVSGVLVILVGVLADLIHFNRRLTEEVLERVRRIENRTTTDLSLRKE